MAKNEAKIKFTAETGEFNDSIKKSNNEMSKLRAEMKLNEAQMKATGVTVEGLEKKHENLESQLKASQVKVEALSGKVAAAARIFGENSEEATKLRVQLANAQTEEEKLKQAVAACESELTAQKNALQQTETASERLANTIEEQQTELKQLKSEYANVVLEHGKYSREAKDLAKQIDSLSDELNDNQKRMNEVEAAADKLDNSLDQIDETAERVSEGFTVMKGAMADLVADGIQAVAGGLKDVATEAFTMANDVDSATNTFIAKTGASAEEAEKFEGVMTDIYKNNFGENFEDIADSMATVKTALGDMGDDELQKITTDALVLRDTFDMDVSESVRAVNSLIDQFGITADEAYSLMAQGAQNGLNQNGDLMDVVNEYAVQFKNAGYSAEDMFNMLSNGVDSGTWSVDKLGDAVKEFNIRMSDGSAKDAVEALGFSWESVSESWSKGGDDAKEVFNMLFNELDGLENTTEGYGIGVGLLGTMYEDLGQDAVLALSNTQGEITKSKDALKEINEVKYDDLGSAFEGIKRNLMTSVSEPLNDEVLPALSGFVETVDWQGLGETISSGIGVAVEAVFGLVTGIQSAVTWMKEHQGVVVAVASAIGILATAIGAYNVVQGVKAAMEAANVTTVWALVSAHLAQAAAAIAAVAPYVLIVAAIAAVIAIIVVCIKYWDDIVAAVKKCWESIKATLATWGDWLNTNVIQPVKTFFSGLWDGIVSACSTAWETIKNAVKVAVMFIGSIISAAFQIITLPFRFIWENCKGIVIDAWNGIKSAVSTALTAVGNVIKKVWNGIKSFLSPVLNAIKTAVSTAWNAVKTGVSKAVDAVKTKVTSVFNTVKSTVTTIWNGVKSVTTSVWNGIKSGVTSVVNGVKTTVSNVFNGIKTTATNVWNGIKNAIIKPVEAARDKVKGVVDAIKGFFSGMKLSLPKIKLPHFKVTGKLSLNPPSVPKLSIDWYKDGGIMMKPTIFGVNGTSLMAGGEAGPEAIAPIAKLQSYITNAVDKASTAFDAQALVNAIEDLASRPAKFYVGDREIAVATASASDSVNGLRSTFKSRGLIVD